MAESRPGIDLIATRTLRYGTRRLTADDGFRASKRDARLLVAIGKARYSTADAQAEPAVPVETLNDLRAQYATKFGKRAYHGWDADTLRTRIATGAKD